MVAGLIVGAVAVPGGSAVAASATSDGSQTIQDFNGDGYDDVAISASWETVGDKYAAGAVNVLYGSAGALGSEGNQFWTQDSAGIDEVAQRGDNFGSSLAHGDINGDGYSDLVVGTPSESIGNRLLAGVIHVIFGSPSGLTGAGSQMVVGQQIVDQLGYSLAVGDFDGDGYGDLAAGLPFRQVGGVLYAGAVQVFHGSVGGLDADGSELWTQDSPGVPDQVEDGDSLGYAVTTGDFDGDGFADLAVSAGDEDVNGADEAGAVNILYGSATGLSGTGAQLWSQDSPGVGDQAEEEDGFGYSLAAGDLNGDGLADLAIGSFGESLGQATYAGSVNVLYGTPSGLGARGSQFWTQDSPGVPSKAGVVDRFGYSLRVGDFDGDGHGDLAIGVPGEVVGGAYGGAANIVYGSGQGLTGRDAQLWSQGSPGVLGEPVSGEYWGGAVTVGDWNGDGFDEFAAGAIYEEVGAEVYAGVVNVLYGSPVGTSADSNQLWSQDSPGVLDVSEGGDFFGYALS
jgi:hypothetical protein